MSAMSVFNLDWSGYPTTREMERATEKASSTIAKATETMTGKLSGDIKQNSDKISDRISGAIKDNTEKVTDAVKKVATTNAATGMTAPQSAIYRGLMDLSESTARIAGHLAAHPEEARAATEASEAVSERFKALVDAASSFEGSTTKLKGMLGEMEKTLDWLDYRFPSNGGKSIAPSETLPIHNVFCGRSDIPVSGAFGRMSDFS